MSLAGLARYAPLVGDLDAFLAAASRPLPRVVWTNPLHAAAERMPAVVAARCPQAEPLGWLPNAWRVPPEAKPGLWPEFRTGALHVQEEATVWPATLVGAEPGDRVLDLCAAPGNKTALMAAAMRDTGAILAVEKHHGRLSALRYVLDRLGVTCALVHHGGGHKLRLPDGTFQRALADVPCSGEGTSRKAPRKDSEQRWSEAESLRFRERTLVPLQKGLLRKALDLVEPGGTVVYATCTYAPEENEAVLSSIYPEVAAIEPVEAPAGLDVAPGVAEWKGARFREDVVHAARLWPHRCDTGGFFVAKLRRLEASSADIGRAKRAARLRAAREDGP